VPDENDGDVIDDAGDRRRDKRGSKPMQRRKFIVGLGSLAAGGAAVTGTGAFSAMSASRDATIDVVNDTDGLIALRAGPQADGRVYETDGGELKIDFTSGAGGQGVNVNSRYQVGTWNTAGGDSDSDLSWSSSNPDLLKQSSGGITPAFEIHNLDDTSHDVAVEYEVDNPSMIGDASLHFQFVPQGTNSNANKQYLDIDSSNPSDSFSGQDTGSGDNWAAVIFVDTRGATQDPDDLDLSGTLTVSAD